MSNAALRATAPGKSGVAITTGDPATQDSQQSTPDLMNPADRQARIAEAAYFRAERRGFTPGCELDDWLAAENEVDSQPDEM